MEVALIVFVCVYTVSAILDAFYKAGGTTEMIVAAVLFIVKCFIYLLLFGLCIQIVGWLVVLLYRLYKRFKRWRHSRRAMRESCCELEEEDNDSESSRFWEWLFWG